VHVDRLNEAPVQSNFSHQCQVELDYMVSPFAELVPLDPLLLVVYSLVQLQVGLAFFGPVPSQVLVDLSRDGAVFLLVHERAGSQLIGFDHGWHGPRQAPL